MKTSCFDAVLDFSPDKKAETSKALLTVRKTRTSASVYFYKTGRKGANISFVRVQPAQPLSLKWKDRFTIRESGKPGSERKGLVLNPFSMKASGKKIKKRLKFLSELLGNEKEMLLSLAEERGVKGLKQKEMLEFSGLRGWALLKLSQELEAEGKARILSFSPLFLLARSSLDFLSQRVLVFLAQCHKRQPGQSGVPFDKIKKRFDLDPRILSLVLKHLLRVEKIKEAEDTYSLSEFKILLSPEDVSILSELEEMCFKGEFQSVSLEDLRRRFHLTLPRLNKLLSLLIERKKIVQGKDGFFLHSRWLDEVVKRIKSSGKAELRVSDFKKMTGLSRKYAIPLLELLDQMGVTRRKGPLREIL